MEFNEKLLELRKKRGLTQEELAQALYVSRAAISKWESGRGYPGIDSLKAIGAFFAVTIDELLSADRLLTIAEGERKERETRFRDRVFGLLDCSAALIFFLPLFGQERGGVVQAVSLITLAEIAPWLRGAYCAAALGLTVWGITTLALQSCRGARWMKNGNVVSLALNAMGAFLFIVSRQPYAAAFLFLLFAIKVLLLAKKQ